jgi:hypothetical protein
MYAYSDGWRWDRKQQQKQKQKIFFHIKATKKRQKYNDIIYTDKEIKMQE